MDGLSRYRPWGVTGVLDLHEHQQTGPVESSLPIL